MQTLQRWFCRLCAEEAERTGKQWALLLRDRTLPSCFPFLLLSTFSSFSPSFLVPHSLAQDKVLAVDCLVLLHISQNCSHCKHQY